MASGDADFRLRNLADEDLPALENLWADELGFDMTVNSIKQWYRVDPEGFFGIFLDDKLVASGSAVKQTGDLYFVGTIGVSNSYRGKGLCRKIISRLFERCPGGSFALFAVPDCLPMYRKLGFKVVENSTAYAYCGKAAALPYENLESAFKFEVAQDSNSELIRSLIDYDTKLHGFEREIVKTLVNDEDGSVVACIKDQSVVGFVRVGTNRKDGGVFIGPLYADFSEVAYLLMEDILVRNRAQAEISVFMFVSSRGGFLAEKLKLEMKEDLPKCCTNPGRVPLMEVDKIFAFDSTDFAIC